MKGGLSFSLPRPSWEEGINGEVWVCSGSIQESSILPLDGEIRYIIFWSFLYETESKRGTRVAKIPLDNLFCTYINLRKIIH
jgi:hypothetical protein